MATSKYFSASLGGLDEDLRRQLGPWMSSRYVSGSLVTSDEGATTLHAESRDERSAKSHKLSLRNAWKLDFPPDFLALLSRDDFQDAVAHATGPKEAPDTQSYVPEPYGVEALRCCTSLPPAFDQRAQELLAAIGAASPSA
jgi:hypothetical protein